MDRELRRVRRDPEEPFVRDLPLEIKDAIETRPSGALPQPIPDVTLEANRRLGHRGSRTRLAPGGRGPSLLQPVSRIGWLQTDSSEECPGKATHFLVRQAVRIPPFGVRRLVAIGPRYAGEHRGVKHRRYVRRLITVGVCDAEIRATKYSEDWTESERDPGFFFCLSQYALLR